jgi:methylase of polypeptide subunit release factors
MKTIQDILTSGTAYLEARGVEGARHSMQSLLVHVLGKNKTWLYLHYDDPLSEEQLVPLRELLRERGKGVPPDDKTALLWRIRSKAARGDRAAQSWLSQNDK